MVMAISPISSNLSIPNKIDRLSDLPDALLISILSFLPTRIAARTSLLSRRFQHLWEASPSVHLDLGEKDLDYPPYQNFLAMADSALLRRNPSHPLLSFSLDHLTFASYSLTSSLVFKACSFSLRHLTVKSLFFSQIKHVLSVIFSMKSLESLSLTAIAPSPPLSGYKKEYYVLPSATSLTSLTTLTIQWYVFHPDRPTELNQLLSQLPSLQALQLGALEANEVVISSRTIRKLKFVIFGCHGYVPPFVSLRFSLPLIESLHLENDGNGTLHFPTVHGETPMLKTVVVNLNNIHKRNGFAISALLRYVSHAEELILQLKESEYEMHPFPILLEQGQDSPNFPKLKHLDVSMFFHEDTFQSIISMLQQSPALESVRLNHELPKFTSEGRQRKREDWKSMFPRNEGHNHDYVYFKNLHLSENRKAFMKLLNKDCASKRQERN